MKITVKLSIGYGYVGADHETVLDIPDEDLEGKTESEKEALFNECAQEWAENYIEVYWEEEKEA